MKFGVLQFFSWPGRRVPLGTVYGRALERIDIMDAGGFDAVWLAEHHFSTYSVCPSVHLMGMHAADRTRNLRIGTGVSLAAFYHPLRLAEEVALLDNLSGGRVNWGAGRGFDRKEMEVFGVSRDESYARFRENVEVVLAAWRDGPLDFSGRFNTYRDVEVLPKPLQNPMPTWIASTSAEAIEWAARRGHAILLDPHATHVDIAAKFARYQALLAEGGFGPPRETPIARLLAIAPTDEAAEEIARQGARWTLDAYAAPGPDAPGKAERIERYVNEAIIHGSPAKVVDELARLEEEMPLDYLLASVLSHETFLLLADEVVPKMGA